MTTTHKIQQRHGGGRIFVEHPIYLPHDHLLTKIIIEDCHRERKHDSVILTMAKV